MADYSKLRSAGRLTGTIKAAKAKRKARYWLRQGHPSMPGHVLPDGGNFDGY